MWGYQKIPWYFKVLGDTRGLHISLIYQKMLGHYRAPKGTRVAEYWVTRVD